MDVAAYMTELGQQGIHGALIDLVWVEETLSTRDA